MSHSVTIQTRTVTTGSPSMVNTTFCRSWSGILKLAQVIMGAVCVGLMGYIFAHINQAYDRVHYYTFTTEGFFFMLIATTFMIASFLIVLSCLCSYTTDSILSKTIFELLYHAFAFALILAASVTLIVRVNNNRNSNDKMNNMELAAAICGLINTALYFISTLLALRTSRGL